MPWDMGRLAKKSQANGNGGDYVYQDVLGQFPFLDGCILVIYGFQTSQSMSREEVAASVHASVAKLCNKIPWLCWHVTTTSENGKLQAQPWLKAEKHHTS